MARTPPRRGLNCRLKNVTVGNTGRRENVIFTGYTSRRATHDHLMGGSMQSIPCALVISDTPPRVLSRVSILVRESNLKKKKKKGKRRKRTRHGSTVSRKLLIPGKSLRVYLVSSCFEILIAHANLGGRPRSTWSTDDVENLDGRANSIVRSRIHLGQVIDRSLDGGGGIEE